MKNNIAVLLTANVSYDQKYIWGHLENTVEQYKKTDPSAFIVICGNGYCPEWVSEKYETCWNSQFNDSKYGWEQYIHLMPDVFDIIENCGKTHMVVSPMLCWISDPEVLNERLIVSGKILNKNSIVEQSIVYGKVRTVKNIYLNRTWNSVLTQQANIYRNVSNVVGIPSMDKYVINNQQLSLMKRVVISREKWEDIPC